MRKDITVFIDLDGVIFDFESRYNKMLEIEPGIKYPQSQYGFFANLDPIDGAAEAYKFLNDNFNVHILTAPSHKNFLCYTEKAVSVFNLLGEDAAERMIISGYKDLCIGEYLIDDNSFGCGQDYFKGKLIEFNQEYNNWFHIVSYFKHKYL